MVLLLLVMDVGAVQLKLGSTSGFNVVWLLVWVFQNVYGGCFQEGLLCLNV